MALSLLTNSGVRQRKLARHAASDYLSPEKGVS
jgi:hypothetical protein